MPNKFILAIDLGTSHLHCLVGDILGQPIGFKSLPHTYRTVNEISPLAKQIDPARIKSLLAMLVKQTLVTAAVDGGDISAISITSQRQGIALLDAGGRELYVGPNIDLRAISQGNVMDETMAKDLYAVTGHLPSLLFAPARLKWFQEQQPHVFERISTVLTIAGWIGHVLTGEQACEASLAGETALLDMETRTRPTSTLSQLGLPTSILPPLVRAGSPIGVLRPTVAQKYGLQAGIPVTLGGPDSQCALMGMGINKSGQVGMMTGWSATIQMVTSAPIWDKKARTWVGCYTPSNQWISESNLGDSGHAYRWLKEMLLGEKASFAYADSLAKIAKPGHAGILAFIGPGPTSMAQVGLRSGGLLFPTPLSYSRPTTGELLRSALENIAFSCKANLTLIERTVDTKATEINICGGLGASTVFPQLLANTLGRLVRIFVPIQRSAIGAGLGAAVASGTYSSLEKAISEFPHCSIVLEPDSLKMTEYEEYFEEWLTRYHTLQEANSSEE